MDRASDLLFEPPPDRRALESVCPEVSYEGDHSALFRDSAKRLVLAIQCNV